MFLNDLKNLDELPPNSIFTLLFCNLPCFVSDSILFVHTAFRPVPTYPYYHWGALYRFGYMNDTPYHVFRSYVPRFFGRSDVHRPFPWSIQFEPFYSYQISGDYMCKTYDSLWLEYHSERSPYFRGKIFSEIDHVERWLRVLVHSGGNDNLYFSSRDPALHVDPSNTSLPRRFSTNPADDRKYTRNYGPVEYFVILK